MDAALNSTSASYTLPSGSETYTAAITPLTTANSPASVTIDGGGRAVTGNANTFKVGSGVTLTLKNITFKTVPLSVAAGGTLVLDTGAIVRENAGDGITLSGGILEMNTGAVVRENRSGVNVDGGTLEMSGSALITANNFSGVMLGTNGSLTMNGGTISSNYGWVGGGVCMGDNSAFTMNGGVIANNTSEHYGGGIMMSGGGSVFNMTSGEISGNKAMGYGNGGGIYILAGRNAAFTMSGGVIRNNEGTYQGGGMFINGGNTFTMTGGEITGNISSGVGGGVWIDRDVLGANGKIIGDPSIGSKVSGKGSIYGNTPTDVDY
jgi:hypothetical protein